jgi:DNA-binding CsgD family transcriptional regulator
MRGLPDEAAATLATLAHLQRPFRSLDYERSVALAWVVAGQGAVSEAITGLHSAAEMARASGRFAAEVLCLQTATQFGDRTCGPRLGELQAIVEGPRVGLAARFAAAVGDGDAAELDLVSEGFEAIGDQVAAVDAAALAAMSYRRQDLRGSALGSAGRAEQLAEECGRADTPMLRQAREPLPLTTREREIAMLIGQGLSNRDVAERLTLSVRTVENHVCRAMQKTGTANREALAALVCIRRRAIH